jgi:hypothetical protein
VSFSSPFFIVLDKAIEFSDRVSTQQPSSLGGTEVLDWIVEEDWMRQSPVSSESRLNLMMIKSGTTEVLRWVNLGRLEEEIFQLSANFIASTSRSSRNLS